jgi:hypothetical protein
MSGAYDTEKVRDRTHRQQQEDERSVVRNSSGHRNLKCKFARSGAGNDGGFHFAAHQAHAGAHSRYKIV